MNEPSMIDQMSEHELRSACKELSIDYAAALVRERKLQAQLEAVKQLKQFNSDYITESVKVYTVESVSKAIGEGDTGAGA